jgi:hypothetical protein
MGRHTQKAQKKKAFIEALEKSLGVVTQACKIVGISRRTVYNWRDDDPEFRGDMDEINEVSLDFAESQLFKQIQGGNVTATIFYLKTKGKKRGYVERQEVTGAQGGPIQTESLNLDKLSLDELENLDKILSKAASESESENSE